MNDHVVTRFAPSPTGKLHSGAYRTAIFAYLYARHHAGTFVLRIEDTDKERSKKEYEENILESLAWIGISHDVFVRQSENVQRHKQVLEKLIADGFAYISREEAKDGSGVIKEIVRFKNPGIDITFEDAIKGSITMHTADLGDFVIAKNLEEPLFHLAVVVDDFDEGITHVIRGEDHVSNTPRQILLQRAIGAPTPMYAHLPLVLGEDKQKLSKRKGALALTEYRDRGYLTEAILNMVTMVGWNPGTEQELFSLDELVAIFDLDRVHKASAVFNPVKLDWFNREYIKKLPLGAFVHQVKKFTGPDTSEDFLIMIAPILQERITSFNQVNDMIKTEFAFLLAKPTLDPALICWKETSASDTKQHLTKAIEVLRYIHIWDEVVIRESLAPYMESIGKGPILWPLRYGLTGQKSSPDPFTCANLLGRDETIARIETAIASLL